MGGGVAETMAAKTRMSRQNEARWGCNVSDPQPVDPQYIYRFYVIAVTLLGFCILLGLPALWLAAPYTDDVTSSHWKLVS